MNTQRIRRRTFVATFAALAVALAAGTNGALASGEGRPGDYASPELLQLGSGPGGPHVSSVSPVVLKASTSASGDYGSPEIIQLGYGPGGPRASE